MKKKILVLAAVMSLSTLCVYAAVGAESGAQGEVMQAVSAEQSAMCGMPNPFIDCATLEEAEQESGVDIEIPDTLFVKYDDLIFRAIKDDMIEIIYRNDENDDEIRIRKAKGSDDISGDYREYLYEETVPAGDVMLTLKGGQETVHVMTWTQGEYTFSFTSDEEIDHYAAAKLVQMIR